jgi:ligand-binding sensor domain-containing protein
MYTEKDGLASDHARFVYQDRKGAIWVSSESAGIARQTGTGWHVITPRNGLAGLEVKAMLEDVKGDLWLGTERGITRIQAEYLNEIDSEGKP